MSTWNRYYWLCETCNGAGVARAKKSAYNQARGHAKRGFKTKSDYHHVTVWKIKDLGFLTAFGSPR